MLYPIILVHGIARFDKLVEIQREKLGIPDGQFDKLHYFKGVKTFLESRGAMPVFHSDQAFAGPLSHRAGELAKRIEEVLELTDAEKVHLIAHSMGGLDGRCAIVDHGMSDKVAILTTIGTPHLGTPLADRVLANGGGLWIETLKAVIDLQGFSDLTVRACSEFNARSEGAEAENDVVYQTYSSSEAARRVFLPLVPSFLFLESTSGANDGLVPVNSQRWKNELVSANGVTKKILHEEFPFPADHLNQVGWWDLGEAIHPILGGDYIAQRNTYENGVKEVYLRIAGSQADAGASP